MSRARPAAITGAALAALAVAQGCGGDDDGDSRTGRVSPQDVAQAREDERFTDRASRACARVQVPAAPAPGERGARAAAVARRRSAALRRQAARLRTAGRPDQGRAAVSELRDVLERLAQLEDRVVRAARNPEDRAAIGSLREQATMLESFVERRAHRLGLAECAR